MTENKIIIILTEEQGETAARALNIFFKDTLKGVTAVQNDNSIPPVIKEHLCTLLQEGADKVQDVLKTILTQIDG